VGHHLVFHNLLASMEDQVVSLYNEIVKQDSRCINLALKDVTNTVGSYVAQIQMDKKYALVI